MLGGSSSHNGVLYVRGNRQDWDEWEARFGLKGWRYSAMLPYLKRIERTDIGSDKYRGREGAMWTHRNPSELPYSDGRNRLSERIEAMARRHKLYNEDYNGERQLGWSPAQSTVLFSRDC